LNIPQQDAYLQAKLRFAKLIKIFPVFYGTQRYITMFMIACGKVVCAAGKFQIRHSSIFDEAAHI
jgi:hypothetical protein